MILRNELLTDPLGRGYASKLPHSPGIVADMMNAPLYSMPKEKFVSARGLLAAHGFAGAAILDKLEAAAPSVSMIKWALSFLKTDSGIDVGHASTRALIDQLVVGGVLTVSDAELIKNMAIQPASRAEILGIKYVQEADIRAALAGA
jgi:hypothetical protein